DGRRHAESARLPCPCPYRSLALARAQIRPRTIEREPSPESAGTGSKPWRHPDRPAIFRRAEIRACEVSIRRPPHLIGKRLSGGGWRMACLSSDPSAAHLSFELQSDPSEARAQVHQWPIPKRTCRSILRERASTYWLLCRDTRFSGRHKDSATHKDDAAETCIVR